MTDLLPCPFCGKNAALLVADVSRSYRQATCWSCGCPDCGMQFRVYDRDKAIAAWNRRASDARHAEDQAALASLQQQLDMSIELLAHAREAASILMNKRIAADEARDACAKELVDVKRQLVETDTLVACLRGPYLMQNHLPALALEGEDFARTFLRLTKASIERFRARLAATQAAGTEGEKP